MLAAGWNRARWQAGSSGFAAQQILLGPLLNGMFLLEWTSVRVVDAQVQVGSEAKVACEPEALIRPSCA